MDRVPYIIQINQLKLYIIKWKKISKKKAALRVFQLVQWKLGLAYRSDLGQNSGSSIIKTSIIFKLKLMILKLMKSYLTLIVVCLNFLNMILSLVILNYKNIFLEIMSLKILIPCNLDMNILPFRILQM